MGRCGPIPAWETLQRSLSERHPISLSPPLALTPALWFPPGGWKLWSLWGECTRDCGGGLQTRTRTCLPAAGMEGGGCEGVLEEGRLCNRKACGRECRGGRGGQWREGSGVGPGQVRKGRGSSGVEGGARVGAGRREWIWSGQDEGRNPGLARSGAEGGTRVRARLGEGGAGEEGWPWAKPGKGGRVLCYEGQDLMRGPATG